MQHSNSSLLFNESFGKSIETPMLDPFDPGYVDGSLEAAIDSKYAFKNRRVEKSWHLKNAFPAGFEVNKTRTKLYVDTYHQFIEAQLPKVKKLQEDSVRQYSQTNTISHNKSVNSQNKSIGYTSLTLGGNVLDDSFHDHDELMLGVEDQYRNFAGPTLQELMKQKRLYNSVKSNNSVNYPFENDSAYIISKIQLKSSRNASSGELNSMTKSTFSKSTGSLASSKVYHAPSSLPKLSPKLIPSYNNLIKSNPDYEQFIKDRNSNKNSQVWHAKGNDVNFNYSAFDFSASNSNSFSKYRDQITPVVIPALPNYFITEIFTINQILKSSNIQEHHHQYILKTFTSDVSLQEIKHSIIQDIIESIYNLINNPSAAGSVSSGAMLTRHDTFNSLEAQVPTSSRSLENNPSNSSVAHEQQLPRLGNHRSANAGGLVDVSIDDIDLILHIFNPQVNSWRVLRGEEDWKQTKYDISTANNFTYNNPVLASTVLFNANNGAISSLTVQLMYALESKSEQRLLLEIQRIYAAEREKEEKSGANAREKLSLKDLTLSLENPYSRATSRHNTARSFHTNTTTTSTTNRNAISNNNRTFQPTTSSTAVHVTTINGIELESSVAIEEGSRNWESKGYRQLPANKSIPKSPRNVNQNAKLISSGQSILYPKKSAKLKELQEQSEGIDDKMKTISQHLERQILKTKYS